MPNGDQDSPFPQCFVCGPHRAHGDGLRIFAGPLHDRMVAAPWVPIEPHTGPEFVWAALDCPGAYACGFGDRGILVLGRLAARVEATPRASEQCVVVAWPLGDDGRKALAGTALYGEGSPARRREGDLDRTVPAGHVWSLTPDTPCGTG